MSNYSFSQLMHGNLMQSHDASVKMSFMTSNTSNTAMRQISRTSGEATLSDFSVAPQSRSQTTNFSSLRELSQGRTRQLRKENN